MFCFVCFEFRKFVRNLCVSFHSDTKAHTRRVCVHVVQEYAKPLKKLHIENEE